MPRADGRLQQSDSAAASEGDGRGPDRLLLMGCYSVFVSMYMLVSLVAPFFPSQADNWGITPTEVGFITSCDPLGEVVAAVFSGWLIAKLGTKKAAVGGMAANGLAGLCFGLAPLVTEDRDVLVPIFVFTRMVSGGATTVAYVAVFTMLCVMQPDKVGEVTAYCNVLSAVGLMVGPLFGGAFSELGASLVAAAGAEPNWQFATPFLGCSLLLVAPNWVLWHAGTMAEAAAAETAEQSEGEEGEEVSFKEEWRRMYSMLSSPVAAGASALLTSCIMLNAQFPILGPHLEARATAHHVVAGSHHPFGFSNLQNSLVFSINSAMFLPMSMWIGSECDVRGRDFPWLRRMLIYGLLLNILAYGFMGPIPGGFLGRGLETSAAIVMSQLMLGLGGAFNFIAAFPFIEGVCELTPRVGAKLTTEQRITVAGILYNTFYSAGCALGGVFAGFLAGHFTFAETATVLAALNIVAIGVVLWEAHANTSVTGGLLQGFWSARASNTDSGDGDDGMQGHLLAGLEPAESDVDYGMSASGVPGSIYDQQAPLHRAEADSEKGEAATNSWAPALPICILVPCIGLMAVVVQAVHRYEDCAGFYLGPSGDLSAGGGCEDGVALGLFDGVVCENSTSVLPQGVVRSPYGSGDEAACTMSMGRGFVASPSMCVVLAGALCGRGGGARWLC